MKVADFFEQTRHLPVTTRERLVGNAPFVVLSPHPDDETLGVGGLIKQASDAGQQVAVVTLTDGAGSHPDSRAYPPSRLIALRKQEVLDAATLLGVAAERLHHFDQPDAHAPSSGPVFEQTVHDLAALLIRYEAAHLFVTWGHDPHCDHETAAAIAAAAVKRCPGVKLWAYPIWGWHLDPDKDLPMHAAKGYRIDIAHEEAIKAQAIAAHRSQMTDLIADDPDGFRFSPDTLAPFMGRYEYFYEIV